MATNTKGKRRNKKAAARRRKRRLILVLAVEAFLLVLVVGGLWAVNKLGKIQMNTLDNVSMNEDIAQETQDIMKGYTTIALFGIDRRMTSENKGMGAGNRSDTIIIANINNETNEVRMVSVYRDTYLNLANDQYNKCNGAYAAGGPDQAVQMLNMNLDLNIQYYVSVDWVGLIKTIDLLGGLEIDVDDVEWTYVNDYILETAYESGVNTSLLEGPGLQRLDGVQATSFCRIRQTSGDDYKRTERQREVLSLLVDKAKKAGLPTMVKIVDEVFPRAMSNFTSADLIARAADAMSYEIGETSGFPYNKTSMNLGKGYGDCVIPIDLEENVKELHKFLFDEDDYYPSPTVIKISDRIKQDTGVVASE